MRIAAWLLGLVVLPGCATAPGTGSGPARPRRLATPRAERVQAVLPLVRQAAARHHVPEDLVLAVIQVESSFRPGARSHAGARGLMQLMPRTAASLARRLGREDYDVEDPAFNIEAGTAYLAYLLDLFDGEVELALAGYNTGPMRVRRWARSGRGVASAEVRRYVATVQAARRGFRERGVDSLQKPAPRIELAHEGLDRQGLRALLAEKEALYGERPDEPLPPQTGAPASQPAL
jgi:soluble lytic murein transglycosylase-like protein